MVEFWASLLTMPNAAPRTGYRSTSRLFLIAILMAVLSLLSLAVMGRTVHMCFVDSKSAFTSSAVGRYRDLHTLASMDNWSRFRTAREWQGRIEWPVEPTYGNAGDGNSVTQNTR